MTRHVRSLRVLCSAANRGLCKTRVPAVALIFATTMLTSLLPSSLSAQQRGAPRAGRVPDSISSAVISAYNNPASRKVEGRFVLSAADTIAGTLAVLSGPVIVGGTVLGDLVVINGDMRLDSTAVITGSVYVVGGVASNRTLGRVDGDMQVWRSSLAFRNESGQLVAEDDETMLSRYSRWRQGPGADLKDIIIASGNSYNRVEQLSILFGPRLRLNRGASRFTLEALGIFRTGDQISWERQNLGSRLLAEFRQGTEQQHFALGVRHTDEVAAVEQWSLSAAESGLTSLLFARDYRDYWNRFGGSAFVRVVPTSALALSLAVGRERWDSRDARNAFALFRGGRDWRPNPAALEGAITLVSTTARIDTRNNTERPRDGWLIQAEYERGDMDITRTPNPEELALSGPNLIYGRAFVDARRYVRIAPLTSVNIRVVAGGLVHGNALPPQRQLSVSGVDALPGYAFRGLSGAVDVGMCNILPEATFAERGRPAACDRIALVQAELKGDFRIALFGAEQREDDRRWYADGLRADGSWVVFANSGRGWLSGPRDGGLTYPRSTIPSLSTFRSDVGLGVDFGMLGVYVAQPLSGQTSTPRVFLRVGARF